MYFVCSLITTLIVEMMLILIYLIHWIGRIKLVEQKRVLDDVARRRRQRKVLEALESDNFSEDPHADLKMSKKAPKFDEAMDGSSKIHYLLNEISAS